MKVCVCHLPNGACVLKRSPFGAQPVRAQVNQIVHKARRNAEMTRGLAVAMSLIDIRNNTPTQLKR